MKYFIFLFLSFSYLSSCKKSTSHPPPLFEKSVAVHSEVKKAVIAPVVDGNPNDPAWKRVNWNPLNQLWQGKELKKTIQYKVTWTPDALYLLVALDTLQLNTSFGNPLENFQNQDRLVVYLDENNSGGDYSKDHSAFAYKILANNFVIATNSKGIPATYKSHINNRLKRINTKFFWEFRVTLYDESYCDNQPNEAVVLKPEKKIGFALALRILNREGIPDTQLGSVAIPEDYKNRIETDSGLFATLQLIE